MVKLIGGTIMSILENLLTMILGNKIVAEELCITFGVMGVLLERSHEYGGLCIKKCWLA